MTGAMTEGTNPTRRSKKMPTTPKLDLKRVIDAGVGVTDLAVQTVRDYSADAQKRLATAQKTVQKSVVEFDVKSTRAAIEKRVADLQAAGWNTATDTYGDLVKRGQSLVGRIRRQQSTREAVAAAETTVAKAKTTRTQVAGAGKATKKTAAKKRTAAKSSAKATGTAAKKTVSAGSRALADAAQKVGD
jgi:heparin binding hemagglutinin HbhA